MNDKHDITPQEADELKPASSAYLDDHDDYDEYAEDEYGDASYDEGEQAAFRTLPLAWMLPLAGFLLLVLIAVGVYWFRVVTVSVPSVTGKTIEQAQQNLEAAGFVLGEVTYDPLAEGAEGGVVSQRPAAGSRASGGSGVAVVVAGPELRRVPNVTGMTAEVANRVIRIEQLEVGEVAEAFDEIVEAGEIVTQTPSPGRGAPRSTPVAYTISRGPEPRPVPNVVGLTTTRAKPLLSAARLQATFVTEFSTEASAGVILGQSLEASRPAAPGSAITVLVSKGPRMIRLPRVIGLRMPEADTAMKAIGMNVRKEIRQSKPVGGLSEGYVYRQEPGPGAKVAEGSVVRLFTWTEWNP